MQARSRAQHLNRTHRHCNSGLSSHYGLHRGGTEKTCNGDDRGLEVRACGGLQYSVEENEGDEERGGEVCEGGEGKEERKEGEGEDCDMGSGGGFCLYAR